MLRGFFVGALVGFAFGSSKQGLQIRKRADEFLTDLMSNGGDDRGESKQSANEPVEGKFGRDGRRSNSGRKERGYIGSGNGNGNGQSSGGNERGNDGGDKPIEHGVPLDKAKELAEALNAKPTTPPTDELEPGEHAIGA